MLRRWFLLFLLGLVIATRPLFAAPPNILLIVADDMSPDAGCYGNSTIRTPHLDRLAAEGVRMIHAYCTTASCSASRSVLLTGLQNHANAQYGHEHSYHHFRTYDNLKSLPVRLSDAGYRTARIGKLHVGPPEVYRFDRELPGNARSAIDMANRCRDLFAEASDKPFFLYFCTADPHRDGQQVAGDPLGTNSFGNRPKAYPGEAPVTYDPANVQVPSFLPDSPTSRAELAQYYQSISRVDQGVGKLVELLKETKQYDNTLIVFTSDHGMAFPGAKTNLYEPGMHIPLILRGPGVPKAESGPGKSCSAMVSMPDITATLLDFAGATPKLEAPAKKDAAKPTLHGRSFRTVLASEQPAGWDEVYASHTFHEITMYYPMRVVRTRTHKLIWNIAHPLPFPFASDLWEAPTWQAAYKLGPNAKFGQKTVQDYIHRPQFELYDLQTDPGEARNLAADPKQAELLAEMKARLKAFQKRTSDPWLLKWDYE
jgi:N-sulfoglucosamine sulfohydrolase